MIGLDDIDLKLIGRLQAAFPLTREPYADLGLELGIDGAEVIHRIEGLKARGIVRQISPVLDARRLGYQSTLVAMKVAGDHLPRAEEIIREHPGVSHGYERDHDFNIWITLAAPHQADMNAEVQRLAAAAGAQAVVTLPALKVFKLRTYFGEDNGEHTGGNNGGETGLLPQRSELSQMDRLVINELQQDLLLVPAPFTPLASRLDLDVAAFLVECQSLLQRGIIRRFGAAINHANAGYKANAMSCWVVPGAMVDAVGQKLASRREVSHCYERRTDPLWHYNLFAMIHGHARTDCQKITGEISRETGLDDYIVLFSTREFKKIRIKYLV